MLRDHRLNKILQKDGFVVLDSLNKSLIDNCYKSIKKEFNELDTRIFQNNNTYIDVDFHTTFLDNNKEYKNVIFKNISLLINDNLKEHFIDYKILQANLFNKVTGKGIIVPHQNLTTIDEEVESSYAIWIPLNDTNELNGTIYLTPGSQRKFEKYRNHNKHWSPLYATEQISDYNMIPMNLKKGQILIFDDSIIHASPVNQTAESRVVFHATLSSKDAQTVYCLFRDKKVDLIKVSNEFWKYFTPGDPEPTAPIYKTVPFEDKIYSKQSIKREISQRDTVLKKIFKSLNF